MGWSLVGLVTGCGKDTTGDTGTPVDADNDGYDVTEDCDDSNPDINPGAFELCDEDLVDEDCDGLINDADTNFEEGEQIMWYLDEDADGFGAIGSEVAACADPSEGADTYVLKGEDCDDTDAAVNPDAQEICDPDNVDEDCNGEADDEQSGTDPTTKTRWFEDADSDGYGNPDVVELLCDQPSGTVTDDTDCDDTTAAAFPGADEYCDGIDNNCDSEIDEDSALDAQSWYVDADMDGYGDAAAMMVSCSQPSGYVSDSSDCDDATASTYPGADEYCDGVDNDCDTDVDEDSAVDASTWYADADTDGYGDATVTDVECTQPSGYVADNTDCNDSSSSAFPGATEYCDGIDNNCDNAVDEDAAVDATTWYADSDSDGYGDAGVTDVECNQPSGYVANSSDCDDSDKTLNQDDSDSDGYSTCDGDCDDSDSTKSLSDNDSDGYSTCDGDCDDSDATLNLDDIDLDGFSTCDSDCDDNDASLDPADDDGDGLSTCDGDCDDTDSSLTTVCDSGEVQMVDGSGTWIGIDYEVCGSGTSCDANDAKAACAAVGKKVVSHASNGTSSVTSLGAAASCYWSIGYYRVDSAMPSGSCLVGVSNLEWSNLLRDQQLARKHDELGSAGVQFGYISSNDTGYNSSYTNASDRNWGCTSESNNASVPSGCSTLYVACM